MRTPRAGPDRRDAGPPRPGSATASGTSTDAAEEPAPRVCYPTADRPGSDLTEGIAKSWSTRELADLAGTTARAVRHYHDVGLLEEPRRRANGYKQYGVAHLVRVVRIKRLADLGFTLPQISELRDADRHPRDALRGLDAHLARTLDRLQEVRSEVRQILQEAVPTDLPPALAARIRDVDLSDADRALLIVLTRVLDLAVVTDFVDALRGLPPSPVATAFDQLPADADDSTRHELSTRLLSPSRTLRVMLPRLRSATTGLSVAAARVLDEAVRDLYNPPQADVLRRAGLLLRARPGPIRTQQIKSTVPQRHGVHATAIADRRLVR